MNIRVANKTSKSWKDSYVVKKDRQLLRKNSKIFSCFGGGRHRRNQFINLCCRDIFVWTISNEVCAKCKLVVNMMLVKVIFPFE